MYIYNIKIGTSRLVNPIPTLMAKATKIGRDARTGEFITVREAQRRPNTTTVETLPKPKPSPKK
ncbi:hypothetical protein GCM10011375_40700 [Hymenobacter qilianensis]|uniref:Uncharacterized protein n=1 Tax=Hymenobacter qilianensis TaxID=1385715 RepID=A0ACB5PXI2_9BACT|nr:hypothetical protein GCM10011375_40700 [Hymenobacter qilianensis]